MRVFISGTDTDVGKSVVTAALAAGLSVDGDVVALKPVASGVPDSGFGEDAELIAAAAGHEPMVCYTFQAPISPHRAAWLEQRSIDADTLIRWVEERAVDVTLIEGVGGYRSPLACQMDGSEIIEQGILAEGSDGVVIVGPNKLGVISQVRAVVEAIRNDGYKPVIVVLNQSPHCNDESVQSNASDIELLTGVPVVTFPTIDPSDRRSLVVAARPIIERLMKAL